MPSAVNQTQSLVVRSIASDEAGIWNEFASGRGGAGLYHRAEWDRAFAAYRLPVLRLAAFRDGQVAGILPLVWQRSLLFGNQLVSLPWFDAAGVLADGPAAQSALVAEAMRQAAARGSRSLQLRQAEPLGLSPHVRTDKVLLRLALAADGEAQARSFRSKLKNQIGKGPKMGLTVAVGGRELVEDFYRVYSENMRDLGSPPHHRRFFQAVWEAFPNETRIYVVRHGQTTVGTGWTMANGDRLEIPWASSLEDYNSYCVNHLMYSRILIDAAQQGYDWFHFGRSTPGTGPYNFKMQWGPEPCQLYWYFSGTDHESSSPAVGVQERFGWGQRLWRRLPLPVARLVGPKLIAKIP